jgi:glycosyltransferase involved in cell wall biosynthesis
MRTSGMTILRNTIQFDYAFEESIRSALPLCDEFIVVVGQSDDGTREAVEAMNEPKIQIVDTEWSKRIEPQKLVLAQQTNIGLHLCRGDWVIYLQANEVLHESSLPVLEKAMDQHREDPRVEALLLERLEFYMDYDHFTAVYPYRYKYTPKILRPYIGTYSIRDAMSVAVFDHFSLRGRYPRSADTGEDLFRYGQVRSRAAYSGKQQNATHLKDAPEKRPLEFDDQFNHFPRAFIQKFTGSHPAVMTERIEKFRDQISLENPRWRTNVTLKERQRLMETWFYRTFGIPGIRSKRYKLIGNYHPKDRSE